VIPFDHFQDLELRNLVGTRPWREICWTSAACLLNYCLLKNHESNYIGYVDADCFFFGDIASMVSEIPEYKEIAIHEHNFSDDRLEWASKSGRFNVGVVIGRPSSEFTECIKSWRENVIQRCDVDLNAGRCGDQTYLNEWPEKFDSLYIFRNSGVGVAPWNLNNYKVSMSGSQVRVDNENVYFFHFHGLEVKTIFSSVYLFVPAGGYQLNSIPLSEIYLPYLKKIYEVTKEINLRFRPFGFPSDFSWFVRNLLSSQVYFRFFTLQILRKAI
jgi:hypothetical protein